jgi:hypothetical protein
MFVIVIFFLVFGNDCTTLSFYIFLYCILFVSPFSFLPSCSPYFLFFSLITNVRLLYIPLSFWKGLYYKMQTSWRPNERSLSFVQPPRQDRTELTYRRDEGQLGLSLVLQLPKG